VARHPPLSSEEEVALARRAREGDVEASEALIRGNLQLVVALARRYVATGLPLLDLVEEGNLGLMHAVDAYDPDRGPRSFRPYAMWWIRQALTRRIAGDGGGGGGGSALQDAWDEIVATKGRQPTMAELADVLGVSEDEVRARLGSPPPPAAEGAE
jgi:RNA polymerase primary sigma factor